MNIIDILRGLATFKYMLIFLGISIFSWIFTYLLQQKQKNKDDNN